MGGRTVSRERSFRRASRYWGRGTVSGVEGLGSALSRPGGTLATEASRSRTASGASWGLIRRYSQKYRLRAGQCRGALRRSGARGPGTGPGAPVPKRVSCPQGPAAAPTRRSCGPRRRPPVTTALSLSDLGSSPPSAPRPQGLAL